MTSSDSINFDVKRVDTQLAEEYMKTKTEIHPIGFAENGTFEKDAYNNKIFLSNIDVEPDKVEIKKEGLAKLTKLYDLANLIKKNANLFCQLEYLLRGLPIEDVKKYDLQLIINNLLYCFKAKRIFEVYNDVFCDKLAFLIDTPLAVLGFVSQSLFCHLLKTQIITIISNKHTAVVASLFVDLCHQVGLEQVKLLLVSEDTDCSEHNLLKISDLHHGCVGVVSNKSDIDSAVDTFLSSSSWYPWRVNKIFIQESALKRFNSAMKWKTRDLASVGGVCEVSFSREDKLFVLEPGSVRDCTRRLIVLEAYRTVKELLSLIENEKPFAVSLWCSDLAETNEVAHNIDANIVWVNDLANFQGPPQSSQAFYSIIDLCYSSKTIEYVPELDQIKKLRAVWLQRSAEERETIVRLEARKQVFMTEIIDEQDFQDSFVHVFESSVVLGKTVPAGIWHVDFRDKLVDSSVVNFLMKGGGLLVTYVDSSLKEFFTNILHEVDAPVVGMQRELQNKREVSVLWKPCYKHKVIWTNYGTIFAN